MRQRASPPLPYAESPLGELSRITRNLEDLNCRLLQFHGTRWVVENNYNYETTKILDPSESDILIKKTFLIAESKLTVSNITFYHMCLISLFSWNNCKGTSRKYPQVISDKLFTDSPLNGLMFACDLNLAWDREAAWLSDVYWTCIQAVPGSSPTPTARRICFLVIPRSNPLPCLSLTGCFLPGQLGF